MDAHPRSLLARKLSWFMLGVIGVGAAGCSREPDPVYVAAEATARLPDAHQKQIMESLEKLFGTPTTPYLRIAAQGASDGDGDESPELVDVYPPDRLAHGAEVFLRLCAGCHGATGDGQGEAAPFLQPRPRDYRQGIFKFTSTPFGEMPVTGDIVRIVKNGAKGTSMPSFRFLPDEDIRAVVEYVIMIAHRGQLEITLAEYAEFELLSEEDPVEFDVALEEVEKIHSKWVDARSLVARPLTAEPANNDESVRLGRKAFLTRGCSKCHGDDFRGQTIWLSKTFVDEQESKPENERILINYDRWGHAAPAADLTAGMLHGGRRPIDIYWRIYTGINGTPMPSFSNDVAQDPDAAWHMVHYVLSVVDRKSVPGLEDVKADPITTGPPPDLDSTPAETPTAPEDSVDDAPSDSAPEDKPSTDSEPAEDAPKEPPSAESTDPTPSPEDDPQEAPASDSSSGDTTNGDTPGDNAEPPPPNATEPPSTESTDGAGSDDEAS